MSELHLGWKFLILAVLLAGIGAGVHISVGIGLLVTAAGFAFAALVYSIITSV